MSNSENVYMMLPRFVSVAEQKYEAGRYLPTLLRDFERNGTKFTFIIKPATVYDQRTGTKHYYLGEREKTVEAVLRDLADEANPNFIEKDSILMFSLSYFLNFIEENDYGSYGSDEIELSLKILSMIDFELQKERMEFTFRAIEELERISENDQVYYCIRFNLMFLGNDRLLNYCLGV